MSGGADRPATSRLPVAFSRPIKVDDLPDDGLSLHIEAEPGECAAVAKAIDLPHIASLDADMTVARRLGGRFEVTGEVRARITQTCVVSLEPFESDVAQEVEVVFARQKTPLPERDARQKKARRDPRREADWSAAAVPAPAAGEEGDPPDPIVDGRIDLGSVAVEFLTLALDFYPKKPGVHFNDVVIGETEDPKPSAFAALDRFKDRS